MYKDKSQVIPFLSGALYDIFILPTKGGSYVPVVQYKTLFYSSIKMRLKILVYGKGPMIKNRRSFNGKKTFRNEYYKKAM